MAEKYQAIFFRDKDYPLLAEQVFKFRKLIFVDHYKWQLTCQEDKEQDAFDHIFTVTCALLKGKTIVGCFRATPGDQPNVSSWVFKELAEHKPWPTDTNSWEVSRFGVAPEEKNAATINYALMFYFGKMVEATALFATTDLVHERLLKSIFHIQTERFGTPQTVGQDGNGKTLKAVAGQIPINDINLTAITHLLNQLNEVEINDASNIFGYQRISA